MPLYKVTISATSALIISGVLAIGICPPVAAQQETSVPIGLRYELTDLGSLGGERIVALGMNDHGMVVGWAETGPPECEVHAFVWEEGTLTDLGTLGGRWAQAVDVNNQGQIIGVSLTESGELRAFYAFDGRMRDLDVILQWPPPMGTAADNALFGPHDPGPRSDSPGAGPEAADEAIADEAAECYRLVLTFFDVTSINEDGRIAACGYVLGHEYPHGFLLVPLSADPRVMHYDYVDLGELPGAQGCLPYCVNDFDEVVGVSGNLAFFWEGGVMRPLDLFTRAVFYESRATAVNNLGLVAGWYAEGDLQPHHGCLWRDGFRFELEANGAVGCEARDVNDANQVVGWAFDEGGPIAALWEGCQLTDLNDVTAIPVRAPGGGSIFPWLRLEQANAIDGGGRIVGFGVASDGRVRAFLLNPISVQ